MKGAAQGFQPFTMAGLVGFSPSGVRPLPSRHMSESTSNRMIDADTPLAELLKAARRAKRLEKEKIVRDSEKAEWFHLAYGIGAVRGWPQPGANNGWMDVTYDVSNWCRACNGGVIQKGPYRFKSELKLGRLGVFRAYCGFYGLFAEMKAWETLLAPFGVKSIPILHGKTGLPLKTAVQLDLDSLVWNSAFNESEHAKWTCDQCGRNIFTYPDVSKPRFEQYPDAPVFVTSQRFGGHIYSRPLIFVRREVAEQIASAKLRYVYLEPVV